MEKVSVFGEYAVATDIEIQAHNAVIAKAECR